MRNYDSPALVEKRVRSNVSSIEGRRPRLGRQLPHRTSPGRKFNSTSIGSARSAILARKNRVRLLFLFVVFSGVGFRKLSIYFFKSIPTQVTATCEINKFNPTSIYRFASGYNFLSVKVELDYRSFVVFSEVAFQELPISIFLIGPYSACWDMYVKAINSNRVLSIRLGV